MTAAKLHARAYRWIAHAVFEEMDRLSWEAYRDDAVAKRVIAELETLSLAAGAKILADFFTAQAVTPDSVILDDLRADFSQLFVGPDAGRAPPFESFYIGAGRYGGASAATMAWLLARSGLAVGGVRAVPADHLSVELAMYVHWSGEHADGVAATMLRRRLLQWAPLWCADVIRNARTGFYRGTAEILAGLLQSEARGDCAIRIPDTTSGSL